MASLRQGGLDRHTLLMRTLKSENALDAHGPFLRAHKIGTHQQKTVALPAKLPKTFIPKSERNLYLTNRGRGKREVQQPSAYLYIHRLRMNYIRLFQRTMRMWITTG
jgi:hypothetical protein